MLADLVERRCEADALPAKLYDVLVVVHADHFHRPVEPTVVLLVRLPIEVDLHADLWLDRLCLRVYHRPPKLVGDDCLVEARER